MHITKMLTAFAIGFFALSSTQAIAAKVKTTFDNSATSPRGNVTINNGGIITLTSKLIGGNEPVKNATVNVYIDKNPTPIRVKTDSKGIFKLTTVVNVSGSIPAGGKTVVWAAQFKPSSTSNYLECDTLKYIHGWRFLVKP